MSKWVIENIELIKKTYVVEAYGKPSAILTAKAQAPTKVETLGEVAFDIHTINEYEYDKDWASHPTLYLISFSISFSISPRCFIYPI